MSASPHAGPSRRGRSPKLSTAGGRRPSGPDRPARRRLLGSMALVPLGFVLGRAAVAVRAAVPFARPGARGSSSRCCAQCGSVDHTMLDRACPAAREVI